MSFVLAFGSNVFVASGDLLRTFRLGENNVQTAAFTWDQLDMARCHIPEGTTAKDLKKVAKRVILCVAHSNVTRNRRLVALGTNEKQIHVIEYFVDANEQIVKCEHIVTSVVPKAPTALAFDREDAYVIVGDRAGDLGRFSVLDGKYLELAGAISMVLDVTFSPDGRKLIMADRDEKVRSIRYPHVIQTHVIDNFCLRHSDYVKTLAVQNNDHVWSAGGDKLLHKWQVLDGVNPLITVDLNAFQKPIRKLAFNVAFQKLIVLLEKSDQILIVNAENTTDPDYTRTTVGNESEFLDAVSVGNFFVLLGRHSVNVLDLSTSAHQSVPLDAELLQSLETTLDAVDNLYKNVTHNNQAEYEKRKAEKFDAIEQKKRRLNDDDPRSSH
ncbi:unnamed protein product [Caenorhabditis sp. 36 PRJEB53466]|nr:unnamed protein product [Caenorhabditis sp. 36 PRJEB53466]